MRDGVVGEGLDDLTAAGDLGLGLRRELDAGVVAGHGDDLVEGEGPHTDGDGAERGCGMCNGHVSMEPPGDWRRPRSWSTIVSDTRLVGRR